MVLLRSVLEEHTKTCVTDLLYAEITAEIYSSGITDLTCVAPVEMTFSRSVAETTPSRFFLSCDSNIALPIARKIAQLAEMTNSKLVAPSGTSSAGREA